MQDRLKGVVGILLSMGINWGKTEVPIYCYWIPVHPALGSNNRPVSFSWNLDYAETDYIVVQSALHTLCNCWGLTEKYLDLINTGFTLQKENVQKDIKYWLHDQFWEFLDKE